MLDFVRLFIFTMLSMENFQRPTDLFWAIHFFYKQLHFLLQPRVAYGHMNFEPESCLVVAYLIHKLLLISYLYLINLLPSFVLYLHYLHFYNPWKHKKTKRFSVFGGYRKRPVAWNEVIYCFYLQLWTCAFQLGTQRETSILADILQNFKIFIQWRIHLDNISRQKDVEVLGISRFSCSMKLIRKKIKVENLLWS